MTWKPQLLETLEAVEQTLVELTARRWLCRGVSSIHDNLLPSIDRPLREKPYPTLSEKQKLSLELASIDLFRSVSKYHVDELPIGTLDDTIVTLMWMRHYGVPTRLLDWSKSPYVAAFFASSENQNAPGDLWAFDHDQYVLEGEKQWIVSSDAMVKTDDRDILLFDQTAFQLDRPVERNYIVCIFYADKKFPRQNAQNALSTVTAKLGTDHASKLAELLKHDRYYRRYRIASRIKKDVQEYLRRCHGIWLGSVYPDLAGTMTLIKNTLFSAFECECRKPRKPRPSKAQ